MVNSPAPTTLRLCCPIRPSSRPCLEITSSGSWLVKGTPECRRTGKWCATAKPRVPKGSVPDVLVRRTHEAEPGSVPHDIDAEEGVLGSILIISDTISLVFPILKPSDFYRERNGWIFEAMLHLQKQDVPIDQITVAHTLEGKLDDIGGHAYLSYLVGRVPTPFHAEHYARIVREMAERRQAIEKAGQMAGEAWGGAVKSRYRGIPVDS